MRWILLIIVFLFDWSVAFSRDLHSVAGKTVGRMLEYDWHQKMFDNMSVCIAVLRVEKTRTSVLLLVGEREGSDCLSVRYWILPPSEPARVIIDCLDNGLKNHFDGHPSGIFFFPRSQTPLLRGGILEKFDVTIPLFHDGYEPPIAWVAFGGEGVTMTVHPEQANTEVGKMVSLLADEAKRDYEKKQRWYRKIPPLVWSSILALIACASLIGIWARKRRIAANI